MTVTTTVLPASWPRSARSRANRASSSSPLASRSLCGHRQQPVGVAVEGQPQVGPVLDHRAGQGLGGGRPAAVVDVGAVGLAADGDHLGTQPLEDRGRQGRGRSVGAVDHQPEPVERPAVDQRAEVVDVGVADARAR